MADRWFYARDGRRVGPITEEQLRQLAATGVLQPIDMVLNQGGLEWVSAAAIPGLTFTTPHQTAASVPLSSEPVRPSGTPVPDMPASQTSSAATPSPRSPLLAIAMWIGLAGWLWSQLGVPAPGQRGVANDVVIGVSGLALLVLAGRAILAGETVDFNGRLQKRPIFFRFGGVLILLAGLSMVYSSSKGFMSVPDRSTEGGGMPGPDAAPPESTGSSSDATLPL